MNLLDRANSFLKGSGKKLALTVVPLAILAAPAAQAMAVSSFSFDHGVVTGPGTGIPSGGYDLVHWDSLPSFQGVTGISLYTDTISGDLDCVSQGDCSGSVTINWTGYLGGATFPGPVPVSWDFSASPDFTWQVYFNVGGNELTFTQNSPVTGEVSGVSSIVAGTGDTWEADLRISWSNVTDASYSVTVPRGTSFDFNNRDDVVPEPASLLLVGPALGLLLLKRRRARR